MTKEISKKTKKPEQSEPGFKRPKPLPLENVWSKVFIHKLIAQYGKQYDAICNVLLDEFNILAYDSQIKAIHESAKDKVARYRKEFIGKLEAQHDYNTIINKANLLLRRRLNRAIRNDEKLEGLNAAFEMGAITKKEYSLRSRTLEPLSVTEIIKIVDHIRPNILPESPAPLYDATIHSKGATAQGIAERDAIREALKSNDTVTLQSLIWPEDSNDDIVEAEVIDAPAKSKPRAKK